jgi:mxaC protein
VTVVATVLDGIAPVVSAITAVTGAFRFDNPVWLSLLPLALLPWWRSAGRRSGHPWTGLLPPDPMSRAIDLGCRALASALIAALTLALAGVARVGQPVDRISKGAEIVILLDRSRSMDEDLAGSTAPTIDSTGQWQGLSPRQRKSAVARRLLGEFVAARPDDRFAMMLFSTVPILVGDFSERHALVRAGIDVSAAGRGLSETLLGPSLVAALRLFAERPYVGQRVVLLVSDGGTRLTPEMREQLTRTIRRERVAVYWIYLRSRHSPGLLADRELTPDQQDAVPEHFLHRFLQSTGMPYRAYEAASPDAMARAIEDIKRTEDRPLRYTETPPDTPLERPLLWVAAVLLALLSATVGTATLAARPRGSRP